MNGHAESADDRCVSWSAFQPRLNGGHAASLFMRTVCGALLCIVGLLSPHPAVAQVAKKAKLSFQEKLRVRMGRYEIKGKPMVRGLLDIIYDYRLPASLEYLDRDAIAKPLDVSLEDPTVADALAAIVSALPQYRITVKSGLVELYSPKARAAQSNLLNATIQDFQVEDVDPALASVRLFGALSSALHPDWGCGGSFAPVGGPKKISLHMQGAKVREILDAIVFRHGDVIWAVRVPPQELSVFHGKLWQIYSLEPNWKNIVLEEALSLFPRSRRIAP